MRIGWSPIDDEIPAEPAHESANPLGAQPAKRIRGIAHLREPALVSAGTELQLELGRGRANDERAIRARERAIGQKRECLGRSLDAQTGRPSPERAGATLDLGGLVDRTHEI